MYEPFCNLIGMISLKINNLGVLKDNRCKIRFLIIIILIIITAVLPRALLAVFSHWHLSVTMIIRSLS
jgi:hypothetical protein